ncbi:response regulator [Methylobacterium sp. 77]|uniref:response regulator n=1 Tax=Methylobacterium sp. 77 TaxID=1101192 RepID=UPI0009DB88F5|nr:response regulator [Methylobacterium sp. 77]
MDARAIDASGRHAGHDTLAPGLALDQIGEALASFYDDLIAEGIPENLAALVRQVHTPEPVSEPDPVVPMPVRKSGRLALVVEDEATTQRLAVSLLDETELEAIGCDSAEEALAVMRDRGGDVALVFADIQLSGVMDGLQLARAVAMLWPTAHMIVTSGRRSPRPDLLPERVVFIPKPWSPKDVLVEAERATHEPPPAVP